MQPGMFPRSLRGYVERALARCKDDTEMAACQAVLKEVSGIGVGRCIQL
jgi:hypothetical protein